MRSIKSAADGRLAGLVLAAFLTMPQASWAEGAKPVVTLFSGDRTFCTRLFHDAHRIEYIAPMLPSPPLILREDTRPEAVKKRQGNRGLDRNAVYIVDQWLERPYKDIHRIFGTKGWRAKLFRPGTPRPPPGRAMAYTLHYAPDEYWAKLARLNPNFLVHDYWPSPEKTKPPQGAKWFALYAVDLDGDGQAEHVLHRRFDGPGTRHFYFHAHHFDLINLQTGKMKTILVHEDIAEQRYTYIRYRRHVYLMVQDVDVPNPYVSIQATMWNPQTKRLDRSICTFRGTNDFREIWRRGLRLKSPSKETGK
jgi:hypothetical protein